MSEPSFSTPIEETVVIVGVGLIGGSLAAALKQRNVARNVIGIGRDSVRIEAARAAGLIDEAATDIAAVIDRADLIVICTPVDRIAKDVRLAETAWAQTSENTRDPGTLLITDAGSVKSSICNELADVTSFIGSHPIAGSHRKGFEAADSSLFEGRICILTPMATSTESQIERLKRFWQAVGMQTVIMTPSTHDRSLAMTSHLPHVVASALASTLTDENRSLTGSGFRDTTRVAAGDPDLWTGILLNNADSIRDGIDEVQQNLEAFRTALNDRNSEMIRKLLSDGQLRRSAVDESFHDPD